MRDSNPRRETLCDHKSHAITARPTLRWMENKILTIYSHISTAYNLWTVLMQVTIARFSLCKIACCVYSMACRPISKACCRFRTLENKLIRLDNLASNDRNKLKIGLRLLVTIARFSLCDIACCVYPMACRPLSKAFCGFRTLENKLNSTWPLGQ